MDTLSPADRSLLMARVRTKNTTPELIVRSCLHTMGYRFRLHRRDLPGTPDIVLPKFHKVIFVHGCYWHGHGCSSGRLPKSNVEFWESKIKLKMARDVRNLEAIRNCGWSAYVVWSCQTQSLVNLRASLLTFLSDGHSTQPRPEFGPTRAAANVTF